MKIIIHRKAYHLEIKGRTWASVLSVIMFAVWLVAGFGALVTGDLLALTLWTLVVGIPSVVLSYTVGYRSRRRIAAIVDAREVPGGVLLVVMDDRNRRHELVTTDAMVENLERALTGTA